MPVIIDDLQVEVVSPETPTDAASPRPAEGSEGDRLLDLLELAREREQRLGCD
jgi:hypothetical protein